MRSLQLMIGMDVPLSTGTGPLAITTAVERCTEDVLGAFDLNGSEVGRVMKDRPVYRCPVRWPEGFLRWRYSLRRVESNARVQCELNEPACNPT